MLFEKVEKNEKDIVFVYTTCGGLEEAREIGLSAVEEKLAISADYWIINSIYPWKNFIQEIDQYMIMFATEEPLSGKLIKHIEVSHTYNVPMIVKCCTSMANPAYLFWVNTTLSSNGRYDKEIQKEVKNEQYQKLK
jgi:uncharacterized protein involved in tolerance to divalent cations